MGPRTKTGTLKMFNDVSLCYLCFVVRSKRNALKEKVTPKKYIFLSTLIKTLQ